MDSQQLRARATDIFKIRQPAAQRSQLDMTRECACEALHLSVN